MYGRVESWIGLATPAAPGTTLVFATSVMVIPFAAATFLRGEPIPGAGAVETYAKI
jgi:hypothetical protein